MLLYCHEYQEFLQPCVPSEKTKKGIISNTKYLICFAAPVSDLHCYLSMITEVSVISITYFSSFYCRQVVKL